MATTTLVIDIPEGLSPVLAFLSPTAAGQVTPNAAGYAMTVSPSEYGRYTISITEALVGIYRIVCTNGDGIEVAVGYTQALTDESVTYWSDASYAFVYMDSVARSRADAALASYDPPTKSELDAAIASVTSSIGGLNDLDAAGIRTAIGMASANLDTQLSTIDTQTDAASLRTALGLAAANIDAQFASVTEKTSLLTPAIIAMAGSTNPVTGQITAPIVIGDDYVNDNERSFDWTIDSIVGATAAGSSSMLGFSGECGASFKVSGTITDNGDDTWTLSHEILSSDFPSSVIEGWYEWSVTVTDDSGSKITVRRSASPVYFVDKQS